jgi:hypothetical protein
MFPTVKLFIQRRSRDVNSVGIVFPTLRNASSMIFISQLANALSTSYSTRFIRKIHFEQTSMQMVLDKEMLETQRSSTMTTTNK